MSRHLILRPLNFRPVAITSRSIQCGPNSSPGRAGQSRHPPGGLDEAVEPLGAEQRLAHGDREVDEDPPLLTRPRRRLDGLRAVLHVRLVVHAAGERKQVVALQPVHRGQQPVRVPVALALHEIDGHQQIQLLERLVELRAVGTRHHRVAAVDDHRPDLAGAGCGDLVGQFAQRVGAGDHAPGRARDCCADSVLTMLGHPDRVDVSGFVAAAAGPVHPPGDHVEHMAEPLGDRCLPGASKHRCG